MLTYAGIAVSAASGALAASRKELDLVSFFLLATITAVGGGTLRDLVLEVPVFWVEDTTYIVICAVVAVLVFLTAPMVESRYRLLLWLDAAGMAAFSVSGAQKGLAVTGSPIIALVTGALTASCGGILRDVLASEPSIVLRPEIYLTAAVVGAGTYTLAMAAGGDAAEATLMAFAAAFLLRGGALMFGWTIPRYRSRPGRPPEELE